MNTPHVLIADDNWDYRYILLRVLARAYPNGQIDTVDNGQSALTRIDARGADLIVTDYKMASMHGLALIEEVRARGHTMPIVMISSDNNLAPQALEAGAQHFLTKPVDIPQFLQLVARLLP